MSESYTASRKQNKEVCAFKHMEFSGKIDPTLVWLICKWALTWKITNNQWIRGQLTIWPLKGIKINKSSFLTITPVLAYGWSTSALVFHYKIVKSPNNRFSRWKRVLSKEEREKIDALLEKHHWPKEEEERERKGSSQWKGEEDCYQVRDSNLTQRNPLKNNQLKWQMEASKRKYKVTGTDIEPE